MDLYRISISTDEDVDIDVHRPVVGLPIDVAIIDHPAAGPHCHWRVSTGCASGCDDHPRCVTSTAGASWSSSVAPRRR